VQVFARQPLTPTGRDVGLAETRYRPAEELEQRLKVASAVRDIASLRESKWTQRGYEEIDRKHLSMRRQADRFESCGLQYAVVRCWECKGPLVGPKRCEVRICASCAGKFAAIVRTRIMEIARELTPKNGKRLAFLTLTKKTCAIDRPSTNEIRQLFRCARKLINEFWPKKIGGGGFATLEVGGNDNLHIHAVIYGHFVPQETISKRWLELTGDSPVVHIRSVRNARKEIGYLLKYVTKPKKTDNPVDLANYLYLLFGIRRIHTYGVFYNRFRIRPSTGCPCPRCGGKLVLHDFTPGPLVPTDSLFWKEALKSPGRDLN
jgi:hypothetical protein